MPISTEILQQINVIMRRPATPYHPPNDSGSSSPVNAWAWPLPDNDASKVKQLIQQERVRLSKPGAELDIAGLVARFPPALRNIMTSLAQQTSNEQLYAWYPTLSHQKVNLMMLNGVEDTANTFLAHLASDQDFPSASEAIELLEANKLPHYRAGLNLVVLESEDFFDILRVEQTDGANYGLDTEDIISKLLTWHQQFRLKILRATNSGVTIKFDKPPRNSKKLITELLEFCPDIYEVDHQDLKKPLELWWD